MLLGFRNPVIDVLTLLNELCLIHTLTWVPAKEGNLLNVAVTCCACHRHVGNCCSNGQCTALQVCEGAVQTFAL